MIPQNHQMGAQVRISFRTTAEFKERCKKAAGTVNLDESVIEAAAVEAVVEHIERYGEITIPVRLESTGKIFKYPAPAPEEELQRAAESPSGATSAEAGGRRSTQYSKSARRAKSH